MGQLAPIIPQSYLRRNTNILCNCLFLVHAEMKSFEKTPAFPPQHFLCFQFRTLAQMYAHGLCLLEKKEEGGSQSIAPLAETS